MRSDLRTVTGRIRCEEARLTDMLRWVLVILLALVLISWAQPLLQRLGLGRLPGDFRFRLFGREWFIPLASTLVLSFAVSLLMKLF